MLLNLQILPRIYSQKKNNLNIYKNVNTFSGNVSLLNNQLMSYISTYT